MAIGRPRTCSCDVCPKCKHRIYMKAWYQRTKKSYLNKEKRREYDNWKYHNNPVWRKRHDARFALAQQVRRGIQTKGPCALCQGEATVGHHNDYDKPLEGTWLCAPCHELIHNALPAF